MKKLILVFAAALAITAPALAETVNWKVTVTANERVVLTQWQDYSATADLNGMGGVQGYVPPPNHTRIDISVAFPSAGVCATCGETFYNITETPPYFSVWYTYLGNNQHKVEVFAGNPGGTPLRSIIFTAYCPNGFKQMTVVFDALVNEEFVEPRNASASGSLSGGPGESVFAAWSAAPPLLMGGTLVDLAASVSGDNAGVPLVLSVNPDGVSGTVKASFPSCAPSVELCDGVDNDCDGAIDEDQGSVSCGLGACATTMPACVNGQPQACVAPAGSPESCDGIDNDCDGQVDEDLGTSSCGVGACAASAPVCSGGQAVACVPLASSPEKCDGIDNDCDGLVDEGCPKGILGLLEKILSDPTPPPGLAKAMEKKLSNQPKTK